MAGSASGTVPLPLSGVRVLDIGRGVAGPFTARCLARLGADVLKVEPPGVGDPVRRVGPFRAGAARGESGPLHLYVNEGKRGLTLNLDTAGGRALFRRLVALSDIVVENLPPSVLPELGLGYDVLRAVNPRLVLTSVSYFGGSGPYRDYLGREFTVFALGGHVYKSGVAGRPPLRMGGHPAEYLAAISAAYATLVAHRFAEQASVGQHVDFSILESQVTSHAQSMVEISYYGEETDAHAPRGARQAVRVLLARDGPVMLSGQEQQMRRIAQLVGAPPELGRPNPMQPGAGRAALQEYIARWTAERSQQQVYHEGQAAQLPASYVATPADLLDSPQYRARGFLLEIDHAEAGRVTVPGSPFSWEGALAPPRPAPRLGEHNAEVYGGLLGLEPADLARLAAAEVI